MDWKRHRREAHSQTRLQEFLRQIVYGGNDGIVTTFAIVAGFAGAASEGVAQIGGLAVLVFGLANLFADGVSMGLGEFLSARSEHDLYHRQRALELDEIARNPEHERMELFEILRQRGLPAGQADTVTTHLADHPNIMADLMLTYEFGMHSPEEDNPAMNGLFTFGSFILFGAVPLLPYFLRPADDFSFWLSVIATGLALLSLGLLRWYATGERALRCILETLLVGTTCALVAYGVGWVVGG
ncbi:GMP synthase [Aliishimia ponticola]|uniref:GMP synthase n=2 Tax=Aliishimia ponticola TaxID=2499833 RepID=A0A4S4NHS4_9RHOB|nr:GMP synthase [Aliishimia ponticola]